MSDSVRTERAKRKEHENGVGAVLRDHALPIGVGASALLASLALIGLRRRRRASRHALRNEPPALGASLAGSLVTTVLLSAASVAARRIAERALTPRETHAV